jgi:RNA polymerase sigma factor (sigma-70 family)
MSEKIFLAEQFAEKRTHLRGVAYRMLGSLHEADDALQETWLRLSRSDISAVENLGGWLTTVVARVCLDMLRSRKSRRESALDEHATPPTARPESTVDPEQEALLADSVGLALLVVLERLPPTERVAFVLHDLFDLPFEEIASIVGRSAAAARQLASRARRRVSGGSAVHDVEIGAHQKIVDAFLAASRGGDLQGLLAVLDPNVVFRADAAAVQAGGQPEAHGAATVAGFFRGRAQAARSAIVDGVVGAVVAPRGRLLLVLNVTIQQGKITALEAIADPARLAGLKLAVFRA